MFASSLSTTLQYRRGWLQRAVLTDPSAAAVQPVRVRAENASGGSLVRNLMAGETRNGVKCFVLRWGKTSLLGFPLDKRLFLLSASLLDLWSTGPLVVSLSSKTELCNMFNSVQFNVSSNWVVGGTWWKIQQTPSSSPFLREAIVRRAGMSILWRCPSSISSADHGVVHHSRCPGGLWPCTKDGKIRMVRSLYKRYQSKTNYCKQTKIIFTLNCFLAFNCYPQIQFSGGKKTFTDKFQWQSQVIYRDSSVSSQKTFT